MVLGMRGDAPEVRPEPKTLRQDEVSQKNMVMCATDRIGFGDDELGKKLIDSFIPTLKVINL